MSDITKQVFYLKRTCMDCGKIFLAVLETGSGKPLNCWYWGKIKPTLKYQWFVHFSPIIRRAEENKSMWQRWLKENIPAYCYPEEEPTVKSIYKRWYLLLLDWLDRTPQVEMWTCPDCIIKIESQTGE